MEATVEAEEGATLLDMWVVVYREKAGAGGRTRTDTVSPLPDFESGASTNFATPAGG